MRIAIAGANGRMGRMLVDAVLAAHDLTLAVALDHAGSPAIGRDAGEPFGRVTGVTITDQLDALADADVLIDFTRPEGTLEHIPACVRHNVKLVIGTTGFDASGKAAIKAASQHIGIVFAPNMSVGVNVTFKLLEVAARILQETYDVEVFEAHHKLKVDAPSGTALGMGEAIARTWGKELDDIAVFDRHGITGEREAGKIGFSVVRGGDIVGEHTAYFCGPGERIEITHRSGSRVNYAAGSLRAARFLAEHRVGQFDMQDVLGLRDGN